MKRFGLILAATLWTGAAQAAPIIDFITVPRGCQGFGIASCIETIQDDGGDPLNGVEVHFSNLQPGGIVNIGNGMSIGSGILPSSWKIAFDADVVWTGGTFGFVNSTDGFDGLTVTDAGGAVVVGDLFVGLTGADDEEGFELATPISFDANDLYTFTALNAAAGGMAFSFMTFEASSELPIPSTLSFLVFGLTGIFAAARRRR